MARGELLSPFFIIKQQDDFSPDLARLSNALVIIPCVLCVLVVYHEAFTLCEF